MEIDHLTALIFILYYFIIPCSKNCQTSFFVLHQTARTLWKDDDNPQLNQSFHDGLILS